MKVVILFSGGMDSSLLLVRAQWSGHEVVPLFIEYGQPHLVEELCAARLQVAEHLLIRKVDLGGGIVGRRESPIVPGRNAALLSVAINAAVEYGAEEVQFGACQADADMFADCRQNFVDAYNAMLISQGINVRVSAPLVRTTKREIRDCLGWMLRFTWSCYFPDNGLPCGECGACVARGGK